MSLAMDVGVADQIEAARFHDAVDKSFGPADRCRRSFGQLMLPSKRRLDDTAVLERMESKMIEPHIAAHQAILLSALGNEKRLQIMSALVKGEFTVGDLADRVGMSSSATSQHLSKLRQLNLVVTRRQSQTIWYTTKDPTMMRILALLEELS
jgi:ArsR family transcriptional regulator, virulence genes transcriptional regulator